MTVIYQSLAYGKSPMAGTYCCQGGCHLTESTGPSGRGVAAPPPPVGGDYPDLCAASDIIACVWGPAPHAAAAAARRPRARAARACMADLADLRRLAKTVERRRERYTRIFESSG